MWVKIAAEKRMGEAESQGYRPADQRVGRRREGAGKLTESLLNMPCRPSGWVAAQKGFVRDQADGDNFQVMLYRRRRCE